MQIRSWAQYLDKLKLVFKLDKDVSDDVKKQIAQAIDDYAAIFNDIYKVPKSRSIGNGLSRPIRPLSAGFAEAPGGRQAFEDLWRKIDEVSQGQYSEDYLTYSIPGRKSGHKYLVDLASVEESRLGASLSVLSLTVSPRETWVFSKSELIAPSKTASIVQLAPLPSQIPGLKNTLLVAYHSLALEVSYDVPVDENKTEKKKAFVPLLWTNSRASKRDGSKKIRLIPPISPFKLYEYKKSTQKNEDQIELWQSSPGVMITFYEY